MKDAKLITTKALPAAGASANHDGIDLGPIFNPGHIPPANIELELVQPLVAALVDDKTIIYTVEDSSDNSSFTTIGLTKTVTGASSAGTPAFTQRWSLPTTVRRYVRVSQAVLTAGGTLTAISTTVNLIVH